MKKYKKILLSGIILFSVLGFLFYWYELRPNFARKACFQTARDLKEFQVMRYEFVYINCMRENGIGNEPSLLQLTEVGGSLNNNVDGYLQIAQ